MVIKSFNEILEEYQGSLNCVEFKFDHITYQLVYDNDQKYYVYRINSDDTGDILGVYDKLEEALDGSLVDDKNINQIFEIIDEEDFMWY